MNRDPVASSVLRSVGYDPANDTLEIEFQSGRIYQYDGVPEFLYRGLMLASSKGGFFNTRIANRFRDREVR